MIGCITGDIVGSIYEHRTIKTKEFPLFGKGCTFTDDTVCTVAIADALVEGGDFATSLRTWCRRYPEAGYGGMFGRWILADDLPAYGSYGNGSAMRVGPVAYVGRDEKEVLDLAAASSAVTHDHPQAVAGAQAVALAMWLARQGAGRKVIRDTITARFGYDLSSTVADIRQGYGYDISSAGTVPPAIVCALRARDFEDAVRNAVSLGGDADTLACIAGGIAEILHGVPADIARTTLTYLDRDLTGTAEKFCRRYGCGGSAFGLWGKVSRLWRSGAGR